jgi:hypothetical protein
MVDAKVAKINGRARAASSVWAPMVACSSAHLAMQIPGRVRGLPKGHRCSSHRAIACPPTLTFGARKRKEAG